MGGSSGSLVLLAAVMLWGSPVLAAELDGRYTADEDPALILTLQEKPDGAIAGTLGDGARTMPLTARRTGWVLQGVVASEGETVPFTARIGNDQLFLQIGAPEDGERLTFRRFAGQAATAAPGPATGTGKRNVIINARRLGDAEVAKTEQAYGIRIPDGEFWYDPVLGAWGGKGGPAMGFITPGLALGGPLRADASGGGTGIFVNGRELHRYDVIALQNLTGPILPGRYFITAQGLAGPEGGQPLWNLMAMAGSIGGGSNTWQSRVTGASGFSDGTTGAVFLPNGGIVSTGN